MSGAPSREVPALPDSVTVVSDVVVGSERHLVRWGKGFLPPWVRRKAFVARCVGRAVAVEVWHC